MKKGYTILYSFTSIMILSYNTTTLSYKKIISAFGGTPYQERIEKEYPLDDQKKLFIENNGDITIKSDWNKKSIVLIGSIHKKREDESIDIIEDRTDPNVFVLRTVHSDTKSKGSVDYSLIVPEDMKLHLNTKKGNIVVHNTHGITMATTENGNIKLHNMHNKTRATTMQSGSVTCSSCDGPLQVTTNRGNITISDARSSITTKTSQGKTTVKCNDFSDSNTINATSIWGNISLYLPSNCNADLQAATKKGTCICDHLITLRPQTTKLNSNAWNKFRRTVNGTIGDGRTPIQVSSVSSNIRIMTNKRS